MSETPSYREMVESFLNCYAQPHWRQERHIDWHHNELVQRGETRLPRECTCIGMPAYRLVVEPSGCVVAKGE